MATEQARYKKQLRHEATVEGTLKTIDDRLARIEAKLGIDPATVGDADGATATPAEASATRPKAARK